VPAIVFKCPFCEEKLETSDENVGREGQCANCERIFEIPDLRPGARSAAAPRAGGGWLSEGTPEYAEPRALVGTAGIGLGLGLLILAGLADWVGANSFLAPYVAGERLYLVLGSAACLLFLALSFLTRKSLVPAILAGGGWGLLALVWVGGLWQQLTNLAVPGRTAGAALGGAAYLAVLAAVLAAGASLFVYFQIKDLHVLDRLGVFLFAVYVVGAAGGLFVVGRHVRPRLTALLERRQEERATLQRMRDRLEKLEQWRREWERRRREEEEQEPRPYEFESPLTPEEAARRRREQQEEQDGGQDGQNGSPPRGNRPRQ
jgi:hypothetical protein